MQRVPELAAILFGAGARRVWHFGSLVWGRAHEASDIDLAVEGLPAASFFEVYDRLCRAAGEPVDLVTLEGIEPAFAERIRAHGRELMRENEYEQVHRG